MSSISSQGTKILHAAWCGGGKRKKKKKGKTKKTKTKKQTSTYDFRDNANIHSKANRNGTYLK